VFRDSTIQISTEIKEIKTGVPVFQNESIQASQSVIKDSKPLAQTSLAAATLDAGRTTATLDVSASGGANFNIPITLPPGLGNAVPQLALVYNSQGGNGIAGYGWNVSGLSSITRAPSTTFQDQRISGLNFDQYDRFSFDGQRLMLKSGVYGGNGAEYQTENFTNIKIISRGVSPYGASYGPEYFEVLYPDGSKAFYGQDAYSRTPTDYAITYSENALGARITYSYALSGNTLTPFKISYGSLGSAAAVNHISFNFVAATRPEQGYVGGLSFYRNNVLNNISVVANGVSYRNYVLSYGSMTTLNYNRLTSIQEFDGASAKSFSPIYFTYGSTGDVITTSAISNLSLSGIASNNSEVLTADFTGNGSMDFLLYSKSDKTKFWAFYDLEPGSQYMQLGNEVLTGKFRDMFPATWLSQNNKILAGEGMLLVKENSDKTYKFEILSSGTTSPVYFQYDRVWNTPPIGPSYYSECDQQTHTGAPLNMEFISGDFNGDGLTDLIAINRAGALTYETWQPEYDPDPTDETPADYECIEQREDRGSLAYFINIDRRLTSNYIISLGALSQSLFGGDKLYTGDLNGDGKTDIVQVRNGNMHVYTMNQNGVIELLWFTQDSRITNDWPTLPGDYNGDGKMDLMFSTGNNSLFAVFMSTGKSFVKHEKNQPFSNIAGTWDGTPGVETMNLYSLIPNDIDGDGKTDMILAQTTTKNNNSYGTAYMTIYHNSNTTSTYEPVFGSGISKSYYTTLKHYPIPIFLNPNKPNQKLEFGFMSDNSISLFKSQKDLRTDMQVTGVSQDGISHIIQYKNLTTDQTGPDIPIYQSSYDQTYPFIDLQSTPSFSVVSKLIRTAGTTQVDQVFGYAKGVTHAQGLGFLGFGEVIRSNWHTTSSDANRTFNITISNPQLRGAVIRSFDSKSSYINPTIKNMALSNPPPATAIADGSSITDYISRTDQVYSTQLLANKVFINVVVATSTKDLLENNFNTQTLTYDTYYNNTKTIQKFGTAGTKTVEATYVNSLTTPYYIGRPLTNKTTLVSGAETFTSQEEYTYTGALITKLKKKGHNTLYVTEDMTYDLFGNVKQKITTAPDGTLRTIKMEYDITGRFLTKETDLENMVTTYTYDPATGGMLSKTNPYTQTESYLYDSWGRLLRTTNYLNVKTNLSYQKSGNNTIITETDDEGHSNSKTINQLGQILEVQEKSITGQIFGKGYRYDVYGRQTEVSQIAQPGSYTQWSTALYDQYGRVKQQTAFTGKVTNISYSGLSTTINDGTKSVTTTKNAIGQVVTIQDPGGTITNTYFANGNLKSTSFGGAVQTIEQDGWGRKTKLIDPSAGQYTYVYDGFGQLTKETTPKGTTDFTFNAVGKLTAKTISGDGTNMQYAYAYNATTKLPTGLTLTNADGNNATYTYTYDANKRISSIVEDNLHARFERSFTYDSFGRIGTQSYNAKNKSNAVIVQKVIEMAYQNGELLQTTLQGTGQVLWKINTIDAKGRLSTALQGVGLKTTFAYDAYGYPQSRIVDKTSATPATLMTLGYSFNPARGTLNSRTNSAFTWNESFTYDNMNRLTAFNDNNGNNTQAYDGQGRITTNSQVGTYVYSGTSYRQSELNLNTTASAYYQARALLQVTYNAFKSPIEIVEPGKDRISFQYNGAMGRSHMYYGGEQTDKMLRRYRRHYAEDGSMEISNDMQTGKTTFVLYLAGNAYSAPAIWKEVYTSPTSITKNLYYLHRDHLGSIVLITNETGAAVEKRVFDAWGNIVKLTDGSGNVLTTFGIIDRGFTGHEHLLSVGLIHMNGRLYDPKLHRFLSPDNFVQDPFNTQNFNRYAYAMNNPLMYTDENGEFLWLAIGIGAAIGALTGGVSYVASAIRTGDWSWGQLGMSMLAGAVIGGITGGTNPMAILTTSLSKTVASAFVSGLLPSLNVSAGNFSFSLSPSVVFGKSFGIGANFSAGYNNGKWNISAGVGVMYYGNYQGFGKGGAEIRSSLMTGYDDGDSGFSLGTNVWRGTGGMTDFKQRTGVVGLHFGDFRAMYENDGGAGIKSMELGDRGDSYRTAALNLSYKDYTVGFNLFTGNRGSINQILEDEEMKYGGKFEVKNEIDSYGAKYKRGYVFETGPSYRLGVLSLGYKNYRFGVDSEKVRHAIQDVTIHGMIGDAGFRNMSWQWLGFGQYKTTNNFSSW
jgi:RHS repeat-associated protein